MDVGPQTIAAGTALANPIILRTIFENIFADQEKDEWHDDTVDCRARRSSWYDFPHCQGPEDCSQRYGSLGVLVRCAQVTKTWYCEAVPLLWTNLFDMRIYTYDLAVPFMGVDPCRRQFYANFVQEGSLDALKEAEVWEGSRAVLLDIDFPQLNHMHVTIREEGVLPYGTFAHVECVTFYNMDVYYSDYDLWHKDTYDSVMELTRKGLRHVMKQASQNFPKLSQIRLVQPDGKQVWYESIFREAITELGKPRLLFSI